MTEEPSDEDAPPDLDVCANCGAQRRMHVPDPLAAFIYAVPCTDFSLRRPPATSLRAV